MVSLLFSFEPQSNHCLCWKILELLFIYWSPVAFSICHQDPACCSGGVHLGGFQFLVYFPYPDYRPFPKRCFVGITCLNPEGETLPVPEADVLRYLKDRYPGKVIYIDVYATWCGPCLEEMRYTLALHEEMQGKDAIFVNLCLQSAVSNWMKLVRKRSPGGENDFFTDDATKLFMGTYRLSGYPSYLLMDRQGRLVTTTAARPSEAKTVKETLLKLPEE